MTVKGAKNVLTIDNFVGKLSKKLGISKKLTKKFYNALTELINETICQGDGFRMNNTLTIYCKKRDPRGFYNCITKQREISKPRYVPACLFSENVIERVKNIECVDE